MNPMDLRRGIVAAVDKVIEALQSGKRTITSKEEISQVATISANGDKDIGDMIARAMAEVGKEGVITVATGKTLFDELEVVKGMRFDRGFIRLALFFDDFKLIETRSLITVINNFRYRVISFLEFVNHLFQPVLYHRRQDPEGGDGEPVRVGL
jgi:chaperonin GroEL (HSP60 family)